MLLVRLDINPYSVVHISAGTSYPPTSSEDWEKGINCFVYIVSAFGLRRYLKPFPKPNSSPSASPLRIAYNF
jgi:hypothetical protein